LCAELGFALASCEPALLLRPRQRLLELSGVLLDLTGVRLGLTRVLLDLAGLLHARARQLSRRRALGASYLSGGLKTRSKILPQIIVGPDQRLALRDQVLHTHARLVRIPQRKRDVASQG